MPIRIILLKIIALVAFGIICLLSPQRPLPGTETRLTSPPLPVLAGRRVTFLLPPGWKIIEEDSDRQWKSDCYSLVAARVSDGTTERYEVKVYMTAFPQDGFCGSFMGTWRRYTISGLEGLGFDASQGRDWFCTIPPTRECCRGYITLKIHTENASAARRHNFEIYVFDHLRYIK